MNNVDASASAVDNLPGFPQETGLAANNTGRVLPSNLVNLEIDSNDSSKRFQEQSRATIEPPLKIISLSSGPISLPLEGSNKKPLFGAPRVLL